MPSKRRVLKPEERSKYWFVDLPVNRPVSRNIMSEEEWKRIVNDLIRTDHDGRRVCHTVEGVVPVGSPAWKDLLRHFVLSERCQMFWEPKRPKKDSFISRDEDGHPVINTLFGVLRGGTPEYTAFLEEQRRDRFLRSRRRK
jgi:hypothetical protein